MKKPIKKMNIKTASIVLWKNTMSKKKTDPTNSPLKATGDLFSIIGNFS